MDFEQALASIIRARTLDDLSCALISWRNESGVAHLVYHVVHIPDRLQPNPVMLLTYEDAWLQRYRDQDYFEIDPVVIAGRHGFLPVDWMTVDHTSSVARSFFAEAESHGVGRHGFTIPIRGLNGERALFTINSNESDYNWHRWRFTYLRDFHLVGHYLHDRVMQIVGLRGSSTIRSLSLRERQCLQGLADGRTPQQISASLHVSASAVNLYLRTARRKLKCATIDQAVVKAVCFELIQYSNPY